MEDPTISGAFETVGAARIRLALAIDALIRHHVMENEIGVHDVVAVLEDVKFRQLRGLYDPDSE